MPEAICVCLLFLIQLAVFLVFWDRSYPQIHDNLDLFMPHYRMMKLNDAWFAHGVTLPVMHGLTRDLFGSEFLLYNVLYILFPDWIAYFLGYFLKIAIGFSGFLLPARDIAGSRESYEKRLPVLLPVAAAYAMIPVFPTYGIAFTSVPLVIWLLRRIYYREGIRMGARAGRSPAEHPAVPYLLLFCYPLLSYFSYHGFFILCYLLVAFFILWVKDRKFPGRIFLSLCVLSAGYIAWEYRLFMAMLFDDTVTIRTTMEHGELTFGEAVRTGLEEFLNASFHSEDSHTYLVLPVVLLGIFLINARRFYDHEAKKIPKDPVNLLFVWILLNCLNFGLYQYAPYRHLLESSVPQLTGFEFARTAYFNTFLWYALFALILLRLFKAGTVRYRALLARVLACAAAIVVMFLPQVYNDFYYTVYNHAFRILKHRETSTVNYREFYSAELFRRILADMDYQGEWSAAYGFHPGILNYNGIASVDGYLGMYPQSYKETWQRVEAPAFAGSPSLKSYFDGWGARVCLYSGSDENTYAPLRVMALSDERLLVDRAQLQALDCRYLFSRILLSNAEELGLREIGTWIGGAVSEDQVAARESGAKGPVVRVEGDDSPYAITVYEIPRSGGAAW